MKFWGVKSVGDLLFSSWTSSVQLGDNIDSYSSSIVNRYKDFGQRRFGGIQSC